MSDYKASWKSVVLLIFFIAILIYIPISIALIAKYYSGGGSDEPAPVVTDAPADKAGEYGEAADMSGYRFLSNKSTGNFILSDSDSAVQMIKSGTALIYIGSTQCEWCQRAVPVLDEVSSDEGVPILYVDVAKESKSALKEIQDALKPSGVEHLYTPTVAAVRKGHVEGFHTGTVDSFEIKDDSSNLNSSQHKELYGIYKELADKVLGTSSDAGK